MLAVITVIVIAAAAILITPVALAGNVTVPVTKITFNEASDSSSLSIARQSDDHPITTNSTSSISVYEYYFSTRPAGWFRTTDNAVNASQGTVDLNFTFRLTGPSGSQDLPMQQLTVVAVGNRTHTLYLSVDQGVRASGIYHLTIDIHASVKAAGSSSYVATNVEGLDVTWKVP